MTASKQARGKQTGERPDPECPELAALVPAETEAPEVAEEPEQPVPAYAEEQPEEEAQPDPGAEPLPKEYVVLAGLASFGPVRIGGRTLTAKKNTLYYVPDLPERADILGTGRFRAATKSDLSRSQAPSVGAGGAITRDLLPLGALKGGLLKP